MSNGATLSYDPLGRLYQVTGSTTTRFLDAGNREIAEYDGSNTLQRWYMPGASADETFVWYEGSLSTRNFIMTDTQGSTAMLADSSGGPLLSSSVIFKARSVINRRPLSRTAGASARSRA